MVQCDLVTCFGPEACISLSKLKAKSPKTSQYSKVGRDSSSTGLTHHHQGRYEVLAADCNALQHKI